MAEYRVLRAGVRQREGERLVLREVGQLIEVSDEAAAQLVRAGYITPAQGDVRGRFEVEQVEES